MVENELYQSISSTPVLAPSTPATHRYPDLLPHELPASDPPEDAQPHTQSSRLSPFPRSLPVLPLVPRAYLRLC